MNTIRLRGPEDVLATLPYQLGYHPDHAIVLVALRDRAVGMVQRLDLPPDEHVSRAVAAMVPPLLRDKPDGVLLIAYERSAGAAMPMLDALGQACGEARVEVVDRLVVREGRWFAPDCAGDCCPVQGMPLPAAADTPAVADFVGLEMAPLPDRGSLERMLAADRPRSAEVARALPRGKPDWPEQALGALPRAEPRRARAVRRLSWLALWAVVCDVSGARPPVEGLSAEELAQLAVSLSDKEFRDGLIAWICPGTLPLDLLDEDLADELRSSLPTPAWSVRPPSREAVVAGRRMVARLAFLCRAAPEAYAPALLTVLANYAWWLGDGALARSAIDRALQVDPGYRLAQLVQRMVDLAIRPCESA